MKNEFECIFCGQHLEKTLPSGDNYTFICHNCGRYKMTHTALEDIPNSMKNFKNKKHLISGYLREMSELGLSTEMISSYNYNNLLSSSLIPKNAIEKLNKFLLYFHRKTEFLYQEIEIDPSQPAIAYAINEEEFWHMIDALSSLDYIASKSEAMGNKEYHLTLRGIEKAETLQKEVKHSKQAFIAIWFDDYMVGIFNDFISNAIKDAGYDPFIISLKEHNDDICDEIIAEIRKSKFLIADFTGQRGGVYFEAGFAYGLGLPVIWTCHEDWFNKIVDREVDISIEGTAKRGFVKEERVTHFDINHYNFIVWKDGKELYEKLKNRILATIL